jgi:hypothetical protein
MLRSPIQAILLAATCVPFLLGGCSSTSSKIGRLYAELQTDVAQHKAGERPDLELQQRHDRRAAEVREILEKEPPESTEDRLRAAVLLVETTDLESLSVAEKLGREVGMAGDKRGYRVAAEAVDKRLVRRGLPQHYGTQYEWVTVLQQWRLYPIDPTTTDDERRAMQVPPLAELYAGEKRLNAGRS